VYGNHRVRDEVGWLAELASHGIGHGEVNRTEAAKVALIELGEVDEGVAGSAGGGEDGPAVIVPVNDELATPEVANETGDSKGGDGRGVLDEDPLRGWKTIGEEVGEVVDLVQNLDGGEEDKRHRRGSGWGCWYW